MNKLIYLILFWLFASFISCDQVRKAEIKSADGYLVETFEFIEDSIKHGLQTKYYKKQIREEAFYNRGKLNGQRNIYFSNGNVEIEERYVDDVISGPYRVFYEDGSINLEAEYIDGKMQGILKRYYESGALLEEVTMKDNEENGPFKEFYENGQVQWQGTYLNGDNEFGELLQFNETGELIKKMMCDEMAVCQTIWTKEKGDIIPEQIELTQQDIE